MMFVLIQRVYIYALWLIVTCGLLLATVNSDLVLVCPDGWHKHNTQCYWFSDFNATRDDAKIECEARNSSLVTISTSTINNFLQQHISNNTNYWIGLKIDGITDTHKWQWSSGQKALSSHYRFIKWCNGTTVGTACAAAVYSNSEPHICYESYNCGKEQRYVCEKEKLQMSSCPDGWDEHPIGDYSTKCYYISVNGLSNMDAARSCWSHGARFITVTYAGPNNYLRDDKSPGPNEVYWIGLSPNKWDDATPYNWNNWDTDGPNIGALCTLLQQDGTWHHGICSEELHNIICQQDATMTTTTITAAPSTSPPTSISTIKPKETPREITFFSSSDRPSFSSVTTMSETSPPTSRYATTPNGSSYMEMLSDKSTLAPNSKLAMYLMIGVYSAVGVVSVVFVGLLATCLVLRKRHISRMKNMSMEQETPFAEVTTYDIDVEIEAIYNSPEIVQIDDAEHRQSSSSGDAANTDIVTKEQNNDNIGSTIQKENGQDTIVRTLSPLPNSTTSDDVITEYSNSNTTQTQQTVTVQSTATSDAGMAHTSVSPRHVLINGEVYAEFDMSRKTIGYDDVVVLQTATNAHCKQSTSSEILLPTCNQDANEQPDVKDTSENVYYNESAQPTYSNEDSDHDLEYAYNNAVPSDTRDEDNSMNEEETYANCADETGGVTYTEVDLSEPNSNLPATEEESVVYSDIQM